MFSVGIFEQQSPAILANEIVINIDGATVPNLEKLHDVLKTPLKFPGYYGDNLDALYDVLSDLAWLNEKPVHLIIQNFDYFLDAETIEKKIQTLLTLTDAGQSWFDTKDSNSFFMLSVQHSDSILDFLEMCEVAHHKLG